MAARGPTPFSVDMIANDRSIPFMGGLFGAADKATEPPRSHDLSVIGLILPERLFSEPSPRQISDAGRGGYLVLGCEPGSAPSREEGVGGRRGDLHRNRLRDVF